MPRLEGNLEVLLALHGITGNVMTERSSNLDFDILKQVIASGKQRSLTSILHAAFNKSESPLCQSSKSMSKSSLNYSDSNIWNYIHCEKCVSLRSKILSDMKIEFPEYRSTEYARRKRTQLKVKKQNKKNIKESKDDFSNSVHTVSAGLPGLGMRS